MQINGVTHVYGIIGDPVAHSLSPLMQNTAFAARNIAAVYVPFHVISSELAKAISGMRALDVKGLNVTIPHKECVLPFLDGVDSAAKLIGAVNTIVNRAGQLIGYNTDGLGLLRSLKTDLRIDLNSETEVIILGAGGAARAAIVTLAQQGVKAITILNRSEHRAQSLVDRYSDVFPLVTFRSFSYEGGSPRIQDTKGAVDPHVVDKNSEQIKKYFKKCHLIVNSTSIGLSGESFNVLSWQDINKSAVVYDMVYAAQPTPLVRAATAAGFVACDGLGMLAAQGEAAFELWTGQCVDGLMRAVLEQHVADLASR